LISSGFTMSSPSAIRVEGLCHAREAEVKAGRGNPTLPPAISLAADTKNGARLFVRGQQLIHETGRLRAAGIADDPGWNAGDGLLRWDRLQHHRPGSDARAGTDLDIAENFRAGADQDAIADLRMPIGPLLAGAAERHPVQDRDIVTDHRGLA